MKRTDCVNLVLFFIILTLFLGGARDDVGVDSIRIVRYLLYSLIVFTGTITYFTYHSVLNSNVIKHYNEICWPILFFAAICFFSILQFQRQWILISAKSFEILFDYFVFLMIAVISVNHTKLWKNFLMYGWIIIVLSILESIYFNGDIIFDNNYRLECVYPYIGTGPITLFSVILLSYNIIFPNKNRIVLFFIKSLCVVSIVLCKSRGGIISFAVAMLLVSFIDANIRRETKKIIVSVLISFPFLQNVVYDQILLRGHGIDNLGSLGGRIYIWDAALEYIKSNFLLGNGYYASIRIYMPQHFKGWLSRFSTLDNPWLDILMGVGLFGLLFYILFVIILFLKLLDLYFSACKRKDMKTMQSLSFLIFVFIFNLTWTASGNYIHLHGFPLISFYLIVISAVHYSLVDESCKNRVKLFAYN